MIEQKRNTLLPNIKPILELNGIWFNYVQDSDGYAERIHLRVNAVDYILHTNITHWSAIVNSIISFIHYINNDIDNIFKIQGLVLL